MREGDFLISDFEFDDGGALPELRLHYRVLGELTRGEDGRVNNAILIMHGTGGSGAAFLREQYADVLFQPGQLLDTTRYCIILPDAIGHGGSSKPSDGLRAQFPEYTYGDMVRASYQLVTEELGIDHLRLVTGTSMGGMHSWLWGYMYPDFMDALMPMASLPGPISGRNRMLRRMVIDAIRHDPAWQSGNYDAQPNGLMSAIHALIFMTSVPLYWQSLAPTLEEADAMFDRLVADFASRFDANDMLYQFAASRDYDPSPHLDKIVAPMTAMNSADDQCNPPELNIMEPAIAQMPRAEYVLLPISPEMRGHGSHSWPALWQHHMAALLARSA